jgi:hypothetical protein
MQASVVLVVFFLLITSININVLLKVTEKTTLCWIFCRCFVFHQKVSLCNSNNPWLFIDKLTFKGVFSFQTHSHRWVTVEARFKIHGIEFDYFEMQQIRRRWLAINAIAISGWLPLFRMQYNYSQMLKIC